LITSCITFDEVWDAENTDTVDIFSLFKALKETLESLEASLTKEARLEAAVALCLPHVVHDLLDLHGLDNVCGLHGRSHFGQEIIIIAGGLTQEERTFSKERS
jgi:hypothetical protein